MSHVEEDGPYGMLELNDTVEDVLGEGRMYVVLEVVVTVVVIGLVALVERTRDELSDGGP